MPYLDPFSPSTTSSKKQYPAVELVRKDPQLAAVLSKLTRPLVDVQGRDDQGNRRAPLVNAGAFKTTLARRAKRNSDSAALMRLLPDIELSAQILISSILSPKDMTSLELIYIGPKSVVTPDLSASLLSRIKEHFEENYKIKELLPEMLRDALFEKGAYPVAVIPENAIDEFINGGRAISTESLKSLLKPDGKVRDMGILGNYTQSKGTSTYTCGVSMESLYNPKAKAALGIDNRVHCALNPNDEQDYTAQEFLVVTDNFATLTVPKLNAKINQVAVRQQYASQGIVSALEAATNISDQQLENLLYRNGQYPQEPLATMKTPHELKRRSVGSPLILKLPSESVIPVHVPGNVKQHIGYFVLLDQEGNPIEVPDGDQQYQGLSGGMGGAQTSLTSSIIRKVETNMGTGANTFNPSEHSHLDIAAQVYADMVERDLSSRVKNGTRGSSVSLAKNEEVNRIMLARVLAKKYTQILYLPIEYVTYIAFKYGDDGIGRSMMDDSLVINSLRTVMLFNDVIASVKNSTGRTKVSGTLPENDPNPLKTIEILQDEIVRSRMLTVPLGVSNPQDITEFLQRSGYEWEFSGRKGIPDLKFEFQQTQTNYTKTDSDLQDLLRKASIQTFGLSPEAVENGTGPEFAATALANNVLLGKRVMMNQEIFTPQVSDHMRKVAANTDSLVQDLRQIIAKKPGGICVTLEEDYVGSGVTLSEDIKAKLLINKALRLFLEGFFIELPKPTSVTLEGQLSDLKTYTEALDEALEAYISTSFFTTDTAGEISNQAETIKALIKAHYVRKFLAEKGIMSELADLTATGDDGTPQLDLLKATTDHVQALVRSGITAIAKLQPIIQAGNNDLNKMGVDPNDTGGDDSGGDEFGGDTGGGDNFGGDFGDMGGIDDLGDTGGDETPSGDETDPDDEDAKKEEEDADEEAKEAKDKEEEDKQKAKDEEDDEEAT